MKAVLNYVFLIFGLTLMKSQEIKVEGLIKQPSKERIRASIVVNDTINKLAKVDSTDFTRRDAVFKEGKLISINDDDGSFTITAKPSDTIFFRFGRLYHPEKYLVSDLLKCDKIIIDPISIPCIQEKKCDESKPSKIYVFVGKKIDVSSVDTSLYCDEMLDTKYRAVYKIDQEFGEHYPKPLIIFTSYDHNSTYEYQFQNYVNVLIFVGEYCDDLIHLKYQFFPVYKTPEGKWATPLDTYMEHYYKDFGVPLVPIQFEETLNYDYSTELSAQQIEGRFPKKYYKTENGKAYPIMGRYAEDLVKMWNEYYGKN